MFIIFAGSPGAGKSTIAKELARRLQAVYLRIDTIEQAIRSSGILRPGADVGPSGYITAYRIAAENLRMGLKVVADSVNPLAITRHAFRNVALEGGVGFLEVEVLCSDLAIHRERVRTRRADVEGHVLPTWKEVQSQHYESWTRAPLQLDTASLSVEESVEMIMAAIEAATLSQQ